MEDRSAGVLLFFFNDTAPSEIYTLPLHDALPIYAPVVAVRRVAHLQRPVARQPVQHRQDRPVEAPPHLQIARAHLCTPVTRSPRMPPPPSTQDGAALHRPPTPQLPTPHRRQPHRP